MLMLYIHFLHSEHILHAGGGECSRNKVGIKCSGDTKSSPVPLRYESPVRMKSHY